MSQQGRENLQHQAEHTHSSRRPAILGYLVILFAVAFLLLLMAYFQQQRQNAEATNDALKQSSSAVESIQTLMEESATLREENKDLQARLAQAEDRLQTLEQDNKALTDQAGAMSTQLEDQGRAMDLFWQIDEAYVRGKYSLCRELIQTMEDQTSSGGSGLKESLPRSSTTDNGRYSPYDRYDEIYDALY